MMKWHCLECRKSFQGPTDHQPKEGCAHCGSHRIFDCNIEIGPFSELPEHIQVLVMDDHGNFTGIAGGTHA